MPQTYSAHDVPYVSDLTAKEDEKVKRILVWDNQAGVVLSNAGNVGLEAGGNAHTYWVPKGDYSAASTHVTGEAASQVNNAVDTIRGGPGMWREHLFSVDTRGYDRMFVEWRGEVTAASGFALASPGASLARAYFFSTGFGWATGVFVEGLESYMREPPVVCYNSAQEGKNGSTLGGAASPASIEAQQIANGLVLWCSGLGPANRQNITGTDYRNVKTHATAGGLMWDIRAELQPLSTAGMIWGYRQTNGASADISRYPQPGDRLSRTMRIGYNFRAGAYENSGGGIEPLIDDLRITGLSRVWFSMAEVFPATTTGNLWPGGPLSRLDFTNASMTLIGKIHVILLKD